MTNLLRQFGFRTVGHQPSGVGPVFCAAVAGNIPVLRGLAAAKADMNERITSQGQRLDVVLLKETTPFLIAAKNNRNPEVLKCLLELRADCTLTAKGNTPLILATSSGSIACMELLLDLGIDLETAEGKGGRPLHVAAARGHERAAELLLNRRAMVDPRLHMGLTPLMLAAFNGFPRCCQVLIQHQADVNAVASPMGMQSFAASMALRMASPFLPSTGPLHHIAMLDGCTALTAASVRGHVEVVKLLLKSQADASLRHRNGLRADELAEKAGHSTVVAALRTVTPALIVDV